MQRWRRCTSAEDKEQARFVTLQISPQFFSMMDVIIKATCNVGRGSGAVFKYCHQMQVVMSAGSGGVMSLSVPAMRPTLKINAWRIDFMNKHSQKEMISKWRRVRRPLANGRRAHGELGGRRPQSRHGPRTVRPPPTLSRHTGDAESSSFRTPWQSSGCRYKLSGR